jgi:hypothetical protein
MFFTDIACRLPLGMLIGKPLITFFYGVRGWIPSDNFLTDVWNLFANSSYLLEGSQFPVIISQWVLITDSFFVK